MTYRVRKSDVRELESAERAVIELRQELQHSEKRVHEIRKRLGAAETQLSNVIRQIVATSPADKSG